MAGVNERLIPCPEPSAAVRLFDTQLPLIHGAPTVERYTTGRGTLFEKHIAPSGVTHWFRVVREMPKGDR